MIDTQAHWEDRYRERPPTEVSWFEPVPRASLDLIEEAGVPLGAAIIDVGGGASRLARELARAGYTDLTVADVSAAALELARSELGAEAERVNWVQADVRTHDFGREFDLWHDRAVLHFMVGQDDRDAYLENLGRTLRPGGTLILATFGPEGPERCSGLPVRRYDSPDLEELLGNEFALASTRLTRHVTPSGVEQQFLYARFARSTGSPAASQA